MRSKVTVVLLFLNVVLFCYIYYYDQPQIRDRELREASHSVLPPEIASMDSFTRTNRAGESFRIQKRGESWWLTAPYEWPANTNAVSLIHNELQFLKNVTSFAVADLAKTGQTLAEYGLTDPAYTVEFTAAGNPKPYKLLVGDDTKSGNRLYVLSPGGDRIHVVSRSLAESVGLSLPEIRAESIFTIPVFEVRSLNIQTAAPANLKVRLRRDAAARWSFESPILARAAKNNVEVAVNALNALTAKNFLESRDTDLDRAGLTAPALRITLEGNARRETLLLGNPTATAGEFYAKIEDKSVVFTATVPAKLWDDLQHSQETLRDPRIVDFDPATVTSLVIAAPGQPEVSLQKLESTTTPAPASPSASTTKDKDTWQVVTRTAGQTPVTLAGDTAIITELLTKIQLLSARKTALPGNQGVNHGFLTDAPSAADIEDYGFNRPEREITLGLNSGGGPRGNEPLTEVLQIGVSPDKPGRAFARLTNPPFVYEILPDILGETPPAALNYRQRLLRSLPDGAIVTSIALVDLGTSQPIYSKKLNEGDKNWDAALASEPEAIRKAVAGMLAELAMLRAQRFATDTFSADHADTAQGPRPWRYRLDYTIAFNGEAAQGTPASLLLTERLGGMTQLAGTTEFGGVVFGVTQELLDALFALTYGAQHDPGPPASATPATSATEPKEAKP
jgi:hypothetical protein